MIRVSPAQRAVIADRAEVEILRFGRPDPDTGLRQHALWHKHVHGVELDPAQILKMHEMDIHPNTVDVSCRRTGKTVVKELHSLEELACNSHQEEGIVAPRLQQSQIGLKYHLDAIDRSDMLKAFIGYKNGRKQKTDTAYTFANHSKATAFGIMSQIDGDAISIASIDEVDDCPQDRLMSRFLPMLGSARRLGADASVKFEPKIRVTGVYKGADVLTSLIATGEYHLLPTVDVYLALALGLVNQDWANSMRAQQTEHEWLRQFCCMNTRATNFIFEQYIQLAKATGVAAMLSPAGPLPGMRVKRRGLISMGYDHSGHGENAHASRSAVVIAEQIGNYITFPYVRSWPPGTDDLVVMRDLLELWRYFRPDYAMGDAYGVGALTTLNDDLFRAGLTDIDRRTIGDGQSTATTWAQWPFAPIRFDGMTKHAMASQLRAAFHNKLAAIPSYDEDAAENEDWQRFVRQVGNVKTEATRAAYASYKMADPRIGDDFFDAACAAVWALNNQGAMPVPTLIASRVQSRSQLLATPGIGALSQGDSHAIISHLVSQLGQQGAQHAWRSLSRHLGQIQFPGARRNRQNG
ncbi:hypothetical protein [Chitinimonas sp.]|uniref:hypothetical protein n=1 Tax=Chitinimonas sp. TaxID=1934313 RepID=UPI0035B27195